MVDLSISSEYNYCERIIPSSRRRHYFESSSIPPLLTCDNNANKNPDSYISIPCDYCSRFTTHQLSIVTLLQWSKIIPARCVRGIEITMSLSQDYHSMNNGIRLPGMNCRVMAELISSPRPGFSIFRICYPIQSTDAAFSRLGHVCVFPKLLTTNLKISSSIACVQLSRRQRKAVASRWVVKRTPL
jgi:hypothetical protein